MRSTEARVQPNAGPPLADQPGVLSRRYRIARLGLSLQDVRAVLGATDQVFDAGAYRQLVVAYKNGAPICIADIGTAIDAAEDAKEAAWLQDKRTIIIDIHKQPGFAMIMPKGLFPEQDTGLVLGVAEATPVYRHHFAYRDRPKNAIMMIDFALDAERRQGLPPEQSIHQAALLRFRPIMMTTMAGLLGALPSPLAPAPGRSFASRSGSLSSAA